MADDDDITSWALAAADGDRAAMERFITITQPDVWRLCAHLVSPDQADDVTQDTYLRALRSLAGYRGDAPARLWLLSIARRASMDALRSKYRRKRLSERAEANVGDGVVELATSVHLDELVSVLDPTQRTAFVATQVLGLSYEEAAAVCECPIGTIRSRVARARAALVERLDDGDVGNSWNREGGSDD